MNVYSISIRAKPIAGAGIGYVGGDRAIVVVTGSLLEAMSIARGKITDKEEIIGIYESYVDVVVDYSQVIKTS